MKSTVKLYRKQPDGSLKFVGTEVHNYTRKECPCQPRKDAVLKDSISGGRRNIVLAAPPKGRGRPIDPLKHDLLGKCLQEDIERRIAELQYEGVPNINDESLLDLCKESESGEEACR